MYLLRLVLKFILQIKFNLVLLQKFIHKSKEYFLENYYLISGLLINNFLFRLKQLFLNLSECGLNQK